ALAQISGKAGRRRVVVLVERRIGIDLAAKALAQDELGARRNEIAAEFGARRMLHAVVGPQLLRPVGRRDGLEPLAARMARRERQVRGRMPVLSEYHVTEFFAQAIDRGHDLVAARHREASARTKVVLHVDGEEDVALAERNSVSQGDLPTARFGES